MNVEETSITTRIYSDLQEAYTFFNQRLFEGRLPDVLLTLSYKKTAHGFFRSKPFVTREQLEESDEFLAAMEEGEDESQALEKSRPGIDEISLNIFHFRDRTREEILSTLVHEAVHVEQFHYGTPPKRPSHNKEWGAMMKRVGLHPSRTGAPGGKETGRSVSHYIVADGPFEIAAKECPVQLDWVGLLTDRKKRKKRVKAKYSCETCEYSVRGKPDLPLHCGVCEAPLTVELSGGDAGEEN